MSRHRNRRTEAYETGMLAVADRLLTEFADLPFLTVAETMNAARRQAAAGLDNPDPDTIYRLTRPRLTEASRQ